MFTSTVKFLNTSINFPLVLVFLEARMSLLNFWGKLTNNKIFFFRWKTDNCWERKNWLIKTINFVGNSFFCRWNTGLCQRVPKRMWEKLSKVGFETATSCFPTAVKLTYLYYTKCSALQYAKSLLQVQNH